MDGFKQVADKYGVPCQLCVRAFTLVRRHMTAGGSTLSLGVSSRRTDAPGSCTAASGKLPPPRGRSAPHTRGLPRIRLALNLSQSHHSTITSNDRQPLVMSKPVPHLSFCPRSRALAA